MSARHAYFPGCRLSQTGREYGESLEAVCRRLDIALEELPDWNCCGAASVEHSNTETTDALSANILSKASQAGAPVLAPCTICYQNLRAAAAAPAPDVVHPLEIFAADEALEGIRARVTVALSGMKIAPYYGCLFSRKGGASFDSACNPSSMDRIIEALSAEPIDFSAKTDCCGIHLAMGAPDVADSLAAQILVSAEEAGANAIAVACPHCHVNLDFRQFEISRKLRRKLEIPVFYFSELMGIAFDIPAAEKWLKRHITTPFVLIDSLFEFE